MDLRGLHYIVESCGEGSFDLEILPGSPILDGHFPGKPVLPGAVIVEILKRHLESVHSVRLRIASLKNVKFVSPVMPVESDRVRYVFSYDTESGLLKAEVYFRNALCARISAVLSRV